MTPKDQAALAVIDQITAGNSIAGVAADNTIYIHFQTQFITTGDNNTQHRALPLPPVTPDHRFVDNSDDTIIANFTPDILVISAAANKPIIRIDPSGRLFWHEREVETDDDFRKAMLELMVFLRGSS